MVITSPSGHRPIVASVCLIVMSVASIVHLVGGFDQKILSITLDCADTICTFSLVTLAL